MGFVWVDNGLKEGKGGFTEGKENGLKVSLVYGLRAFKDVLHTALVSTPDVYSEAAYNALQADINDVDNIELITELKKRFGESVAIFSKPIFKVTTEELTRTIGTSLFLVTQGGCISVTILKYHGMIAGSENSYDWYFWGCEGGRPIQVGKSILVDVNDEFIKPMQDALKTCLPIELLNDGFQYVRNFVSFDGDCTPYIYDSHLVPLSKVSVSKATLVYSKDLLSKQVTKSCDLVDALEGYINTLTSSIRQPNRLLTTVELAKVIEEVNNLLLADVVADWKYGFNYKLPRRIENMNAPLYASALSSTCLDFSLSATDFITNTDTSNQDSSSLENDIFNKNMDNAFGASGDNSFGDIFGTGGAAGFGNGFGAEDIERGIKGVKHLSAKSPNKLTDCINSFINTNGVKVSTIAYTSDLCACILTLI